MWSSDPVPRRAALLAVLALAGCGFTPAYGPGSPAQVLRGAVTVTGGETVFDYRLRTALEDRLGQGDGAAFALAVTSRLDEVQAAVTPDGTITRFNVTGEADWTLTDRATAGAVASGTATAFTSYLTTGSTVSTEAAQRDAEERLAVVLAEQIVARLVIAAGPG
jgi:LPS-assembly lipoprotein